MLELELTFHGFNLMTREISVVNDVNIKNPKCWGWLILFASTSTLLCCALPILLVSLGLGAVVASMASSLPFLVTLSQHKNWMFLGSFVLLLIAGWTLYRPGRACPVDLVLAEKCVTSHKWNQRFYWCAVIVWLIGFFSAYVLVLIVE